MNPTDPSYEELRAELDSLKSVFKTLRDQEADAIVGKKNVLLLRLQNAEAALVNERRFLQQLYDTMADAILVEKIPGRIIEHLNHSAQHILGYPRVELIGKSTETLYADQNDSLKISKLIHEALAEHKALLSLDIFYRQKDGKIFPGETLISFIREKDRPVRVIQVIRDVSERKNAEDRLKASLMEKEVLLKELHHRTKNNMNLISSLLSLQAMVINDEKLEKPLAEMQYRIQAMALVHERLYKSDDLSSIDMADYVQDLAQALMSSFHGNEKNIELRLHIERLQTTIDMAIPCGLIINELMTNALKYAFPPGTPGQISIALHTRPGNKLELIFSDNGVGLPENLTLENMTSLGMKIVEILVKEQLKGKWFLSRGKGTTYRLVFRQAKR